MATSMNNEALFKIINRLAVLSWAYFLTAYIATHSLSADAAGTLPDTTSDNDGAAASSTIAGSELKADPVRVFFLDDFHDEAFRQRGWECGPGVVHTSAVPENRFEEDALRFSWNGGDDGGFVGLQSCVIDLAALPGVEISYTYQRRGVEIGEQFLVEFQTARGRWMRLDTVRSDGRDTAYYTRRTRLLPTAALHANFRLRFVARINDPDDAWYLGEVRVGEYEPLRTLTVHLEPAGAGEVGVVLRGRYDALQLGAPFMRRFPTGSRIVLIAPPTAGDDLFSHWSIGGRTLNRRILEIEMTDHFDVCAHYRPWTSQRGGTTVALTSRPLSEVRIRLSHDPGQWLMEIPTDTEISALTGEWLLLLAPARTARLAFECWIVNGERMRDGETLLEHRIQGMDVLTAEYALLGDMNGDDRLDKFDVDLFIAALIDSEGYHRAYPHLDRTQRCDINGDGVCDSLDLEAFVTLLTAE